MTSFDYQKSTITKYRAGTSTDPYIDITETKKVINGQIQLNEIPVLLNKVKVNGMFEVSTSDKSDLVENVYRVDYVEGMLYFHPTAEGLTLTYNYKGRGNHFVSAARIWTKEQDGNVTQTLEDLVEGASNFIYAGDYSANSSYKTYNIINYQGSSYIAIKDTSGNPPTDSIYWRKLAGGSYRGTYSNATVYDSGDTVVDYDNHNIYRSLISSNSGSSLLDSSKWELTISVQNTITAAELATQDAIESSEEAIIQANYAKDQGDFALGKGNYANQQGQYVDDLITSFVYFGEYQNGKQYNENNQVSMNGTTYICIQDSLGNDPQSSPSYWKVFASGGYTATVKYANEVKIVSESDEVSIGIPLFSQETDILLVYQNSIYITVNTDFMVSTDNTKIEKVSGTWSNGTTFNFIVIKSVPAGNDSFDGALLSPETVTNVKLANDIKVGSLSNLTTIENSNIVGAINELDVNIDSVTSQLAERATKAELTTTNANVATKADKTYTDNQLALKTDKTYTDNQLSLKRDKVSKIPATDLDIATDASKVKLINLSDEVRQAMAGTTPIHTTPSPNSVVTEYLAPSAVTLNKMKNPLVQVMDIDPIIFNFQTRKITLAFDLYIYNNTNFLRVGAASEVNIDITSTPTDFLSHVLYVDVDDGYKLKYSAHDTLIANAWIITRVINDSVKDNLLGIKIINSSGKEQIIGKFPNISSWAGKKIDVLGDSITAANTWQPLVSSKLKSTFVNHGIGSTNISGTAANAMHQDLRINALSIDADLYIVFGGTNDWADNVVMGTGNTLDTNTFIGAYRVLLTKLITKFAGKRVAVMTTPYGEVPNRAGWTDQTGIINNNGLSTRDYAKACRQVANEYGIPVIDIDAESYFNKINILQFIAAEANMRVHPNTEGGKRIAEVVIGKMRQIEPI